MVYVLHSLSNVLGGVVDQGYLVVVLVGRHVVVLGGG